MTTNNRIEIPFSKSKLIYMLMGALAFIAIGLWFVMAPPTIKNSFWGSPTKLTVIGYGSIVFFGLCVFVFVRKLRSADMGLIIDENGIVDNSSALAVGQISWKDIKKISVFEINRQKLIMLEVYNPQDYINREKNMFKKKAMELNLRMYKTPISLNTNGLLIQFDELLLLLEEGLHNDSLQQTTT